ncbi:hypothetical protein ACVWWK_006560 [Bradyrhizobium sp. LB9.1b]
MDWLSRLFEMMPVHGRLDLRCSYGTPWRIDQGPGEANEIPYHAVLAGSAMLDNPARVAGRCNSRPATSCCSRATRGTSCMTAAALRR